MSDREPQPEDGPDYHAEHSAWAGRRALRSSVTQARSEFQSFRPELQEFLRREVAVTDRSGE